MATSAKSAYTPRLKEQYNGSIAKDLQKDLKLDNFHRVPKLDKVVINVGLGRAKDDKKIIEAAKNTITKITGQKPIETKAKNSIASFKLREGNVIGLKVTLRNAMMYEFLDRFINIVMPRLRDFHGAKAKASDKDGNFSFGFIDQSVFPELTFDETTTLHGLQVNVVIKSESPEHSRALLEKFGVPFEKEQK